MGAYEGYFGERVGANARGQTDVADGSVRRELRKLERVMARRAASG